MSVLAEQADAAVGLHRDRRVADEGLVEDLAGRPGGAVVAGHRDGAAVARPCPRVRRVAQQQHLGARGVWGGVREGPDDLGVVHRVGQFLSGTGSLQICPPSVDWATLRNPEPSEAREL